ncbi:hypothetical protein NQ318_002318 [Aromia moschata]|uniref:EF-hand domain-containing protein n=1 Tax=Aromia moschata TaxID=1265417 RepID=A0AAV8Z3P3_9CUCU|nr:hypothetical protein NQ318_002318 [Aromia moschata]
MRQQFGYPEVFFQCDADHDGYVNVSDLKAFVNSHESNEIPEEVAQCILSRFDQDRDGKLDFHEFLDLINNPTVIRTFKRIGSRGKGILKIHRHIIDEKEISQTESEKNSNKRGTLRGRIFFFKMHTVGMILLSIIQFICFYTDQMYKDRPITNALKFNPNKKHEVWRYLTYIYIHSDMFHLYGNILVQILIGVPLEIVHSWRVLVIYAVGAIGASMLHGIFEKQAGLVGGSAGIYAFFTAHIAVVLLNWRDHPPYSTAAHFGIITVFDAIYNFIQHGNNSMVSYMAHLSGAVFGLLLGVIILRNLKVTKIEKILRYTSLAIFLTLMVTLVIYNCIIDME